jgi:hypothetical protein
MWDILTGLGGAFEDSPEMTVCDVDPDQNNPSGCNWETIPWDTRKAIVGGISFNGMSFGDCKVVLTYQTRSCEAPGSYENQVNIIAVSFEWSWWEDLWGDPPCEDLYDYLNGSPTGYEKAYRYDGFYDALYQAIARKEFDIYNEMNNQWAGHNILCNAEGVPETQTSYNSYYTTATCMSTLSFYARLKNTEGSMSRYVMRVPCVESSCCKHWDTYCYEQDGSLNHTHHDEESANGTVADCPNIIDNSKAAAIISTLRKTYQISNQSFTNCVGACNAN